MTVSSVLVRALVEVTERSGVSRQALLEEAGIDARRLASTIDRFDFEDFELLQLRAVELTGDEALGLHLAERASEASFDLVAHLVAHAPTLRHAIEICSHFERLFMDGVHLRLRERVDMASLELTFVRKSALADRMLAEFALTALLRMLEAFGGPGTRASAVHFEHPSPAHRREYARIFSGAERFGQGVTSLDFDASILDRPQLHQHSALSAVLREQAQQQLQRVGREPRFLERVQEHLSSHVPSRIPDMRTTALALGLSVRSLRRRLSEEGVSYRSLVQSTLERSAKLLLGDSERSVQETAHALGFDDVSAFHRAFKRWTGLTPSEFRDRMGPR